MHKNFPCTLLILLFLTSCAGKTVSTGTDAGQEKAGKPAVARVKPAIDYSKDSPDCKTAGQRIAENIEVGMRQKDVVRLVGKPQWNLPGSWWWSASFDKSGKPTVLFNVLDDPANPRVSNFISDTSGC